MKISVLQWNILRRENPDNVVSLIKEINPDIVCAQELTENTEIDLDVSKYISNRLNLHFYYKEGDTWKPAKNDKTSQGNAIFSKYPITKSRFVYLSPPYHNPPDANYEGRVYVEANIKVGDKNLIVGTTHLSFSPGFVITKRRKKETNNLIEAIAANKKSFVFTGDLNCSPKSYVISQLNQHLVNAGPDFDEPTWTTKPFDYHGQFKEDRLHWRLDYIFSSKDIEVNSARIIKTEYSDHLPILVAITL